MTKIICFATQKGGVGKSTLSIHCAHYLISKGKRVLVVDFDPQANTTTRLGNPMNKDVEPSDLPSTFPSTRTVDLFRDELDSITVHKCPGGMDLIHTPKNCAELADIESKDLDVAMNPKKHLDKIKDNYDYIIFDCPPGLGRKLVGALVSSTHVVIPAKLSGFAVDGMEDVLNSILQIRHKVNPDLKVAGIVINNTDANVTQRQLKEMLKGAMGELVLESVIPHRPPIDTATSRGVPVWTLGYAHVASREMMAALDEIIERVES